MLRFYRGSQQLTANYALCDMPFDAELLYLASRKSGGQTPNVIPGSSLRLCLQASRQIAPLQAKCKVTLLLNSGRSVSIHVNKPMKQCFRNIVAHIYFPNGKGNIVSSVQDANYGHATCQGILTKIRACEQLQKSCEHEQASTHLIFASDSSKGQMGPFDTPKMRSAQSYIPQGQQQHASSAQQS